MQTKTPLWAPSNQQVEKTNLTRFMEFLSKTARANVKSYGALHQFSVHNRGEFWQAWWEFAGLHGGGNMSPALINDQMPGAQFFPDATLNFAENLLCRKDDTPALVFLSESGMEIELSWRQLHDQVANVQQYFISCGIQPGDRIAAVMPNMPQTIVAMLAASSIGAIWSSCSPDFGVRGILDRFDQIKPKILVACDGYFYAGKRLDISAKITEVLAKLNETRHLLTVPYLGLEKALEASNVSVMNWNELPVHFTNSDIHFPKFSFNHPLYIMFSSGTTGMPKCIVHGAGGTLLQHTKEHQLQCDLRAGDKLFYFTTCGWMMWNWLASGLASGCTLLLFDGSPFSPSPSVLFDFAAQKGCTLFGTSARYIDALAKTGIKPRQSHDLSTLRTLTSTGSPLSAESFDYIYKDIKQDLHVASISGGTDIVSCFVLGVPTLPVWRGEIQAPGLGMDVDVFDEDGQPMAEGKGELVCKSAFPSMPLKFWNDDQSEKYRAAYFERFPGIWAHGDFAEWTEHGGIIIHGRSDAVLNPGGVRIGTSEIYAQVQNVPQVLESLAIGQAWQDDTRIILFVRLQNGVELDDELIKRLKTTIREGASPRHVPAKIIAIPDLPRTRSGKLTEIAVRDVVHGRIVKNQEALENPEALEFFKDIPALKD